MMLYFSWMTLASGDRQLVVHDALLPGTTTTTFQHQLAAIQSVFNLTSKPVLKPTAARGPWHPVLSLVSLGLEEVDRQQPQGLQGDGHHNVRGFTTRYEQDMLQEHCTPYGLPARSDNVIVTWGYILKTCLTSNLSIFLSLA